MSVDGRAAARALLANGPIRGGYCLYYVWLAYKAVGARTGRSAGTALQGWNESDGNHPGDRNPPAGVPVWFGAKPGSDAGDVVISLGEGRVAATDWPRYGVVGSCTIDERQRQIGRPYLGWSERIFDQAIDYPRPAAPASGDPATPIPKEWDEMASRDDIKAAVAEVLAGSKPNDRFIVAYASEGFRNGIILAGMGYWHPLSGEKWEHFNWLKSAQGRTLFSGLEVFTPINDRSWDILREICQSDGVIETDVVDYARIADLVTKVDVDEIALAEQLTPALVAAMSDHVGTLNNATIDSLVKTLLDEQSKRLAS